MLYFYQKKKKNDPLLITIFGMSLVVFVACAILICSYTLESNKNQNAQKGILDKIDDVDFSDSNGELIDQYASIRDKYPHLVGRLKIQNNNKINDLVVMQIKDYEKRDFYLDHDAEGNKSAAGTAYLDYECDIENMTDNYLIYAHAMKNLTQFGCLRHYKKKSYWEKYPTLNFETMYDKATDYEIFACFYSQRYTVGYEGFKYYMFKDAANKEEFDYFIENVKKLAEYDTGITPEYGEQIITLSTCDYTRVPDEGRFVVCARKKTGRIPGNSVAEDTETLENIVPEDATQTPVATQAPVATPRPTITPTVAPTRTPEPTIAPTEEPVVPEIPTEEPPAISTDEEGIMPYDPNNPNAGIEPRS